MFNQKPEEKKVEVKHSYEKIKKCVMKKEAGEHTEECKETFRKLNILDD